MGSTSHPVPFYDAETNRTHLFYLCTPNATATPWETGGENGWCHASAPSAAGPWSTHKPALTSKKASAPLLPQGAAEATVGGPGTVLALSQIDRQHMDDIGEKLGAPKMKGARAAAVTAGAVLWVSHDLALDEWQEVGSLDVPSPPDGELRACGDVHLYKYENKWRLVMGAARGKSCDSTEKGARPAALLYESAVLGPHNQVGARWDFLSVMWEGSKQQGPLLEAPCVLLPSPDRRPLERLLLWSSPNQKHRGTYYVHGYEKDDGSLIVWKEGRFEVGDSYASRAFVGASRKLNVISWLQNEASCVDPSEHEIEKAAKKFGLGSASFTKPCNVTRIGAQTAPRELTVDKNGTIFLNLASEVIARFSSEPEKASETKVIASDSSASAKLLPDMPGSQPALVQLHAEVEGAGNLSDSGAVIGLDFQGHSLEVDLAAPDGPSMRLDEACCANLVTYRGPADILIREGSWRFVWRSTLLLDDSIAEVFTHDGTSVLTSTNVKNYSSSDPAFQTPSLGVARGWAKNATATFSVKWQHEADRQ